MPIASKGPFYMGGNRVRNEREWKREREREREKHCRNKRRQAEITMRVEWVEIHLVFNLHWTAVSSIKAIYWASWGQESWVSRFSCRQQKQVMASCHKDCFLLSSWVKSINRTGDLFLPVILANKTATHTSRKGDYLGIPYSIACSDLIFKFTRHLTGTLSSHSTLFLFLLLSPFLYNLLLCLIWTLTCTIWPLYDCRVIYMSYSPCPSRRFYWCCEGKCWLWLCKGHL